MALDDSYLTAGTVSVANGATTYTFSGAALLTSGVRAGDKFIKDGHTIVFTDDPVDEDEIDGEAWPGTTLSGATYRIEYLPDGSRLTAKVQELLAAIGDSGNVDALAALVGAVDKLPYFTGAGAMSLADFNDNSRDLLLRWIKATTAGPSSLAFLEDADEGANKVTLRAAAALGADVEFVMDANGADLLLRWTRATAASPASLDFHEDTDDGVHRMRVSVPALTADRLFLLPDANVTMHATAKALLEAATAGAQLTALGVSAFAQTLVAAADASAARTTLGADTLYVSRSIDFSVVAGDRGKAFGVSASGAARTVTLLAAATAGVGFEVIVKKTDGSANTVTIDADAAETIDGATTYVLRLKDNAVRLRSDGVNWRVVASHLPAEYGVGANGSYLRFPNGTQICWQNITVTGTWGASGSVYIFSSSAAGNWAAVFVGQPTMAAFNSSPTSGYFWTAANGCTATDFAGVSLWRASAAGATTNTVGFIGIGRWF